MSLEDAAALATSCIYISSNQKEGTDHIKMSVLKTQTKQFEKVTPEQIANHAKLGKQKFPIPSA
jgi:proteasome alpha subunit